MIVDSSSLKEDTVRMMLNGMPDDTKLSDEERRCIKQYVIAAIDFGTSVIDHDKIETLEDLKQCAKNICVRVLSSMEVLSGQADL